MRLVNRERARLIQQIEQADQQAAKWERALAALDRQREAHQAERERQDETLTTVEARFAQVRAAIAEPLIEQVTTDGSAYLTAQERMWEATAARNCAGRSETLPACSRIEAVFGVSGPARGRSDRHPCHRSV